MKGGGIGRIRRLGLTYIHYYIKVDNENFMSELSNLRAETKQIIEDIPTM